MNRYEYGYMRKQAAINKLAILYTAIKGILRIKLAGSGRGRAFKGIPEDFRSTVNNASIEELEDFLADPSRNETNKMRSFAKNRLNYLRSNPSKVQQQTQGKTKAPRNGVGYGFKPVPAHLDGRLPVADTGASRISDLASAAQGSPVEPLTQSLNIPIVTQKGKKTNKKPITFDPSKFSTNIDAVNRRAVDKLLKQHPEYAGKSFDELLDIANRTVVINPSTSIIDVSAPVDTNTGASTGDTRGIDSGAGSSTTVANTDSSVAAPTSKRPSITAAGLGMTAGGALLGGGLGYGASKGLGLYDEDSDTSERMLGHLLTAGGAVGGGAGGYYLGRRLGY